MPFGWTTEKDYFKNVFESIRLLWQDTTSAILMHNFATENLQNLFSLEKLRYLKFSFSCIHFLSFDGLVIEDSSLKA